VLGEREGPTGPAFADTEPRDCVGGWGTFRIYCWHRRYIRKGSYIP
jgi:hypothetical protein